MQQKKGYELKHIVVEGNSLVELHELEDSADLILTDPPYGIDYQSKRRVVREQFAHFANDTVGDWIHEFAALAFLALKRDHHLYCFTRFDTYPIFFEAFKGAGFTMKRTLIWVKNNHGSGDLRGDYAPQDEWIIFAHKGRRELNGSRDSNILHFDKITSANLLHPTQKPLDLLSFLIMKSCTSDEIVLDPFAGVFSTNVAAEKCGMNSIGIEINPQFVDIGISRLSGSQLNILR